MKPMRNYKQRSGKIFEGKLSAFLKIYITVNFYLFVVFGYDNVC